MKVKVNIYKGVKYEATSEKVADVEYNIRGYEVVKGERSTEIELEIDENSKDEYNEYLIITLEKGKKLIFCNSHVDMFIISITQSRIVLQHK